MLEARNASKIFRGRMSAAAVVAVDDVSMHAEPGEFVAIVGESGSGKSTLARMLLDLIPTSSGSVLLDGNDIAQMTRADKRSYRRQVQAVLQDPAGSLNPRKRVDRAIAEVIRFHGIVAGGQAQLRDKVARTLELVGMSPAVMDRYPHELSGGQRQRVLIARALALDPRIIIADEAVSALDASVKAGVLRVMVDLKERLGVGFVFITHDLPVVRKVADRVYVMHGGKVVEEGPKDRIFDAPEHPYTRTLLAAAPTLTHTS